MTTGSPRRRRAVDRFEAWLEEGGASDNGWVRFIARLAGFVIGSQSAAEAFLKFDDEPIPNWLTENRDDDAWYEFARRVALTNREGAQSAVASLQEKIGGIQNLMTVLVPAALGASAATMTQITGELGLVLFILLASANLALVLGLLFAALASGLLLTLEVSLTRLVTEKQPIPAGISGRDLLHELRLREVRALHNSAWLAMRTSTRLGSDLFAARRYAVIGTLMLAVVLVLAWS